MCTVVRMPGGTTAILCGPRTRAPVRRCITGCGRVATLLCDGPPSWPGRATCDAPLCASCARELGPDRHHCPRCARAVAQQGLELGAGG